MTRITTLVDRVMAWSDSLPDRPTTRFLGLGMALPTLAVLAFAVYLTPDPSGFGTHRQLGLGGCTMLTLTGWPCPMCGMTTTFTLMAHFRVLDAFVNQPFGPFLFGVTVVGAVVGVYDLVTGNGLYKKVLRWVMRREQLLAMGLLVGMVFGWLYKCVRMHPETLSFLS